MTGHRIRELKDSMKTFENAFEKIHCLVCLSFLLLILILTSLLIQHYDGFHSHFRTLNRNINVCILLD